MASRPDTKQGYTAASDPATATSVNESKPPAGGETFPAANAKDAFIGRVLEHYRLEERLGAGGMGLLYRATDLTLKRAVAVKLLARQLVSDETAKARFVQEARAASALDHPNIATVYDIGEEDGELFIVMALYDGETLKQRMEKGRLPVDEAVGILRSRFPQIRVAHRCACPLPKGPPLRRSSRGARRSCAGAARVRSGASAAASRSRKEPASTSPASALARAYAGLGAKGGSMREARRAAELLPISKDAFFGTDVEIFRAIVEAHVGEKDAAIERIRYLLSIPCFLSPALLRIDPEWAPLRDDPRFRKLAELDPK